MTNIRYVMVMTIMVMMLMVVRSNHSLMLRMMKRRMKMRLFWWDDDDQMTMMKKRESLHWTAKTFYKSAASLWSWTKSSAKIITKWYNTNNTLQYRKHLYRRLYIFLYITQLYVQDEYIFEDIRLHNWNYLYMFGYVINA